MHHPLLDRRAIEQTPGEYLSEIGKVYSVFDAQVQDSGNVSYGVQVGQQRFFVKTAGDPNDPRPFLPHGERVALLRNAVRVRRSSSHRALPLLHNVIESAHGPLLVYSWVEGELLLRWQCYATTSSVSHAALPQAAPPGDHKSAGRHL